jgi:hypothetical protein
LEEQPNCILVGNGSGYDRQNGSSRLTLEPVVLAYRKACNRRTSYDDQVLADLRALALAVVLLEASHDIPKPAASSCQDHAS